MLRLILLTILSTITLLANININNLVSNTSKKTNIYKIYSDHLNTPRRVADSQNNIVWSWDSKPFGEDKPTGTYTLNLRFPGQYYDSESEFNYNINRYYNPTLGRYMQSDPIGFDGGVNSYLYANGNSLRFMDELGLFGWDDVAEKIAFGEREDSPEIMRTTIYSTLVSVGYPLGLDSDFERRMAHRWIYNEGDYKLSYSEFIEIKNGSKKFYNKIKGNFLPISTYNLPKYNFAIGSATLIVKSGRITGFYGKYDFNKGNRK